MNDYDSGRIADLLNAEMGYERTDVLEEADLVVVNTCSIREKAQEKTFSDLGRIREVKKTRPGMLIAVGGCVASQEGENVIRRAPCVDVVFGPQTLHRLPDMLRARVETGRPQVDVSFPEIEKFDHLPAPKAHGAAAFVSIMEGCSKYCSYCVVPYTRGEEISRPMVDVLMEVAQLADQGVREVTLLGQNVNSFGYGIGDRYAFSKLLRACGTIDGLERVRFTSPHPAAFTDDVIAAMAETPNIMHQLHFPLQSGSDRILRAMRRSYRSAKFLDILRKIREAMPDAQISTDIIVGFPGETEEDFQKTLRVVEEARFASAFTFIYSPRPGTPAAEMEQVPHDVVQDRFERLVALQERITEENLKTFEGRDVEVMVTGASGKKDAATHRVTGREKTGVLVHVGVPEGEPMPQVGDFVTATITHAGRHNLIADPDPKAGQTYAVRH